MLRSPAARMMFSLLILTAVVVFTFRPCLHNDFVNWDDQTEVIQNPDFNPVTLKGLGWNWGHTRLSLYMPVTYMVWGTVASVDSRDSSGLLQPFAFHLFNLVLHLICSALVFLLIFQLWRRIYPALIGALLFAVHPLTAEPVAWVSGMYTLLSTALSLAALIGYVAYATQFKISFCSPRIFFLLASVFYVIALLTKAASVSIPLAAAVIDLIIIARPIRQVIRSQILWLVLAIPIVIVAKHFQDISQITALPLWARPVVALDAAGFYLRKIILPVNLIPDYGRNPNWVMQHPLATLISAATAIFALLLAWLASKNAAWITAGIGLLIVGISPYLGLTTFDFQYVSTVADRYAYFGLIGIAILATGAAIRSRVAAIALLLAIASWALLSHRQVQHWRDTDELFGYTLRVNPRSLISHNVFGFLAAKEGHPAEAEAHYLAALKIWPEDAVIQFNLGNLYMRSRPELALERYSLAVRYQPHFAVYRNSYAAELAHVGQAEQAYNQWKQAIIVDPGYVDAHNNLADLCLNVGRSDEAMAEYKIVLKLDPNNAHALQQLSEMGKHST